jgi:hypothetical protein
MAGASQRINTAAAGNSCLEYRADNWDPSVTGAMMMASTYRLLAGERPAADERALVLSAQHTSLGQELRNVACRFLLTPALRSYVMLDKLGTCDLVHRCDRRSVGRRFGADVRFLPKNRRAARRNQLAPPSDVLVPGGMRRRPISGRSRATKTADAAGIDVRPDHGKKSAPT